MGMSERAVHIKNLIALKDFCNNNGVFTLASNIEQSLDYAISSIKTDLKYDLMYEGEEMEVTIDKCCTSKETYTVDNIISIMENLLDDMRNSDGGEGALIVDGQKFYTDAGFALEGVEIFIKLFKQRMEVEENVDTDAEQTENNKQ